jgi:arginyl-tRNA synthetase
MKTAREAGISTDSLTEADLSRLAHPAEIDLARKIAEWPRQLESAALAHEPHRIAFYLYDLASEFHGHWNKGKDEPALRFVQEGDAEGTRARLALIRAVAVVISVGLGILGVTPVNEMR